MAHRSSSLSIHRPHHLRHYPFATKTGPFRYEISSSTFSRTFLGLLMYGREVKPSPVHFWASWCTAGDWHFPNMGAN